MSCSRWPAGEDEGLLVPGGAGGGLLVTLNAGADGHQRIVFPEDGKGRGLQAGEIVAGVVIRPGSQLRPGGAVQGEAARAQRRVPGFALVSGDDLLSALVAEAGPRGCGQLAQQRRRRAWLGTRG